MDYRYSFTDLFSKEVDFDKNTKVKVSSVVIPQIQRPYAQGRTDGVCTYIRNTFLAEIFDNLISDSVEVLDLNFIYGIIKPNNSEYKLELLDGQQRLTTLFLLYWYIVNAELDFESEKSKEVRNCLSHFSYETRATSTVFCQELSAYKVSFKNKTPKEVIRNSKWYFKSFDRDSTISAMLTMLDAIHGRYKELNGIQLFNRLQNIQFYVKSLGVFNLSEELYIKMNARGLQLSPFENFKADLTNFISNKDYAPYHSQVPLYKEGSTDVVPFHLNFSIKLDAKWVDIFWKNGADDFDGAFMSFFSRFFACKYIIASKNEVSDKDMRSDNTIKFFYTNAEDQIGSNEYWGFKSFEEILNKHPEYIITLDRVLDVLYQYDCKSAMKHITSNLLPIWDKHDEVNGDDFYCNTSAKMSHVKLIALSAVIEYIEAFDQFDIISFEQWMRVVWNIIENTNIDSLTPVSSLVRKFSAVIHFIAQKVNNGGEFYTALSEWRNENSSERENRALLEEIEKARRISEDPTWENIWKEVEKHPYFKGMVTFFYDPSMSKEVYSQNAIMAMSMFDKDGITADFRKQHVLIRSIVSNYNTWNDINELYITERAEKNKYLKNILASNENVRAMIASVLYNKSKESVSSALQDYIENAPEPRLWLSASDSDIQAFDKAIFRLRHDTKLYDWVSDEENNLNVTFRFYLYEGHFMVAVPRRQYAKVALDTDRARMANELCHSYGFEYYDPNQKKMFQKYGDSFGNSIWINQTRQNCCVWIGFDQHHKLRIQFESKTKEFAKELLETFKNSTYIDNDPNWVQIPSLSHGSFDSTYTELCQVIENIFDKVPE